MQTCPVFPNQLTQPITDHQATCCQSDPTKWPRGPGGQEHQRPQALPACPRDEPGVAKLPSMLYTSTCPDTLTHLVPLGHGSQRELAEAQCPAPLHLTCQGRMRQSQRAENAAASCRAATRHGEQGPRAQAPRPCSRHSERRLRPLPLLIRQPGLPGSQRDRAQ